jgi:hypothetical protein
MLKLTVLLAICVVFVAAKPQGNDYNGGDSEPVTGRHPEIINRGISRATSGVICSSSSTDAWMSSNALLPLELLLVKYGWSLDFLLYLIFLYAG